MLLILLSICCTIWTSFGILIDRRCIGIINYERKIKVFITLARWKEYNGLVIIMMNDKELNDRIDEIIKPFMVKSINKSLHYNEGETVDPELLMSCSFETLDMILLG